MEHQTRTVKTYSPFFLPVAVPFTATLNEDEQVSTTPSAHPGVNAVEILGLITDLENVTSSFKLNKRIVFSDDRIPLALLFGKPDGPKPVRWLETPLVLPQGWRVYCDLLNVGAEAAGTLGFVGRVSGEQAKKVVITEGEYVDDVIAIDSGFTGTLNEKKTVSSGILNDDFLVDGLHTNLETATVEIIGANGIPWNEEAVPLWFLAGRGTSEHSVQRLHDPYLIPRQSRIMVKFTNVGSEASGHLWLKGRRLLSR